MDSKNQIIVKGARQHNLKNISIKIPRDKLVVVTGLSGSGKSSLAFDTIYAEGQRRYVESLSSYARQFLGLMEKPDMDSLKDCLPLFQLNKKRLLEIQDPPWELLLRYMTISDCYLLI